MVKNKNQMGLVYLVIAVVFVGGMLYFMAKQTGIQEDETGGGEYNVNRMDIEFTFDSWVAAAQDDPDEIEYHIFKLGESDDLSDLKSENYFDCDSAFNSPLMLEPSKTIVEIPRGMQFVGNGIAYEPYFCKPNFYKLWQESGVEDNMQNDGIERTCADIGDVDADDGATEECTLVGGNKYLIIFRENIGADVGDVVGGGFIVEVPAKYAKSKIAETDMGNINDGTTNIRFTYDYLSDAMAESETTVFGEWEDDEDNSGNLDSSLNGWCDSSLTTSTSIDLDATFGLKIDKDGYAIVLDNPLASGNSERAYLTLTPYGENTTTGSWLEYGVSGSGITGDVPFSTSNVNTAQMIFQAEMQDDCAYTILGSSGTDAVEYGDEKMYDCTKGKVAKNAGGEVSWKVFVDEVLVDYDDSATANDEEVNCASGSSGEDLFDIDLYGIVDSSDRIAQTLSP